MKYKEIAHHFGCSLPHVANIISGRAGASDPYESPQAKIEPRPHAMPWCTKARLMGGR